MRNGRGIERERAEFESLLSKAIAYARGKMWLMLRRYGEEVVSDVLQEAALKAWRYRRQFEGRSAFNSWFTKIAINEALMHMRRSKIRDDRNVSIDAKVISHEAGSEDFSGLVESIEDGRLDPESRAILMELLSLARPRSREILMIRHVAGYSIEESERLLGLSSSSIKTRTRTALRELNQLTRRS